MSEWSPGIRKVLDHVARTKGWRLLSYGSGTTSFELRRRTAAGLACPISSMCRRSDDKMARIEPFRLGLTDDDLENVVAAADDNWRCDKSLRVALLRAARLA